MKPMPVRVSKVMPNVTLAVRLVGLDGWRMRVGKFLLWLATRIMQCNISFGD